MLRQTKGELFKQLVMELELLLPGDHINRGNGVELFLRKIHPFPVNIRKLWGNTKSVLATLSLALDTSQHPFQDARILTETWPDKLAIFIRMEPIDTENLGQLGA